MARYRFAVVDLFKAQGIEKPYGAAKAMGKDIAQGKRLMDPKRSQINIDLVNELCEFFKCEPGDLFARVDEKPSKKKR
jgi:DNA-binding Xre family transcriptional regulator